MGQDAGRGDLGGPMALTNRNFSYIIRYLVVGIIFSKFTTKIYFIGRVERVEDLLNLGANEMDSEELVELALRSLKCSQKELAHRLGVSPTQISKWKKGEHISYEMSEKLRTIANVGDKIPSFVLLAGSLDDANKWERLIGFLADTCCPAALMRGDAAG